MNDILNGRLYFNEKRDRVERARGAANGNSILMSYHSDQALFAKVKDLRLADSAEVEGYKTDKVLLTVNGRTHIDHVVPLVND